MTLLARIALAGALIGSAALGAEFVDDEIAALVHRLESLSAKETSWCRADTLARTAELIAVADPAKSAQLRSLSAARPGTRPKPLLEARKRLEESVTDEAAEAFLTAVEHSSESPDDYAWFAALRRRHDLVKGGDNASVRAREALIDLADLVRTDLDPRLDSVKGKTAVLSFWATWCGPCLQELPMLEGLAAKGLTVVAITDESDETVNRFLAEHPLRLPILHDRERRLFKRYGVEAMPAIRVLDSTGRLRARISSPSEAELDAVLSRIAFNAGSVKRTIEYAPPGRP